MACWAGDNCRIYLLEWIHNRFTLAAVLTGVAPWVGRDPWALTFVTSVLTEATFLALIRRRTSLPKCWQKTISDEETLNIGEFDVIFTILPLALTYEYALSNVPESTEAKLDLSTFSPPQRICICIQWDDSWLTEKKNAETYSQCMYTSTIRILYIYIYERVDIYTEHKSFVCMFYLYHVLWHFSEERERDVFSCTSE